MIRISIQARQALAKLTLPVLIVATFGLMLLGKADAVVAERARMVLADALAPIYAALAGPIGTVRDTVASAAGLWDVSAENTRLREENEQLRRWQSIALALDAENQRLKADLHWVPDPAPSYITARVVADAGGIYARAVLLSVGPNHGIRKGEIALDERGLVGRVTEVGARTARVLLITDMNSRVPVVLENSGAHAIVIGTNAARPRVVYWPEGSMPQEGERVVTSTEASAFPANLPVGTVHYSAAKVPEIVPAAMLDRLEVVRVFDYGLTDIAAPEAPGRLPERRGR
jgi:rod shape-determining protein MreC